jgi:hypothetical protein
LLLLRLLWTGKDCGRLIPFLATVLVIVFWRLGLVFLFGVVPWLRFGFYLRRMFGRLRNDLRLAIQVNLFDVIERVVWTVEYVTLVFRLFRVLFKFHLFRGRHCGLISPVSFNEFDLLL